ncbi:MAG: damage-inducible protein DinB [Candidatus Brocadiaceae bacterium]|nr:damage-inducible protein DinB [Candidatus Brocadiaceae bacterium]
MGYTFLIDTYETERIKTLSTWSTFKDEDMPRRPHTQDKRGRNAHEHMVHQCLGENIWFCNMLGVDVGAPPLPEKETRLEFIKRYAEDSEKRLAALREKDDAWWEEEVKFFTVARSRAWVVTRRIAHTAHHRGQMTMLLRMAGREIYSTYGPTADTGGLMQNKAETIYPYSSVEALIKGEVAGGNNKAPLPGPGDKPCTERPDPA